VYSFFLKEANHTVTESWREEIRNEVKIPEHTLSENNT
jgi:hypothetical protein